MRSRWIVLAGAVLLAGCGQGGDQPPASGEAPDGRAPPVVDGLPAGPTPGLWRVTTRMSGMPAGMAPPAVETCIREATFEMPEGAEGSPGMTCEQASFRREGDAVVGRSVCTGNGVRTVSDIRVTGDFARSYVMEIHSTMTPPPSPDMAEMTMTMTAERLGDCPADSAAQ